jgi:hypothetical protein
LRDPAIYPDPHAFKPERFLNADGSLRDDPVVISAFEFEKRICPGRHLVDSTLFIAVASLFSVFRVGKGKGTNGGFDPYPYTGSGVRYSHWACLPTLSWLSNLTPLIFFFFSRPIPFSCSILPRDKRAEELILAESLTH